MYDGTQLVSARRTSRGAVCPTRGTYPANATAVAAMLDSARAALLEVVGPQACVAMVSNGGAHVEIVCRLPLSAAHITMIRDRLLSEARQHRLEVERAESSPALINGHPPTEADEPAPSLSLHVLSSCPLFYDGVAAGVLQVSLLGAIPSNRRAPAFEKLLAQSPAVAATLLWHVAGQRNKLVEALSHVGEGVLLFDDEGRLTFASERARELLACGPALESGPFANVAEIVAEARRQRLQRFNRVLRSGVRDRLLGARVQLIGDADDERWWQVGLHDITASWLAERGSCSVLPQDDEWQAPLRSIRNSAELLLKQEAGFLNVQQKYHLQNIEEAVGRACQLLREGPAGGQSRSFGEQPLERRRQAHLGLLIRKAAALYQSAAAKQGLHLRLELPASLPALNGDRDRLMQLMVNLVDNAVKFSPAGGEVIIGAREEDAEIFCWVQDQGAGIPASEVPFLFEPHRQRDPRANGARGHGLGLSIAREIVELHRGRIWVESEAGKGSKFCVALPQA